MSNISKSLLDLSLEDICCLIDELGEKKFRADQVSHAVFLGKSIKEISNIPNKLKEALLGKFIDFPVKIKQKLVGKDGTTKYLYEMVDGNIVEGVLMQYKHGKTLCVSTQVGCRMGCKFCASGLNGLIRNLSSGEMLGQVLAVNSDISKGSGSREITNLVLMGSGEPLDNFNEVVKFIKTINQTYSLNISQRNISLSTCGLPEEIKKLADLGLSITLTISLHAPTDALRQKIMPIANRYKLNELMDSVKYYFDKTGRRVVFEYALIEGFNDDFIHAEFVKKLMGNFSYHINLIPLNSVKERGLVGTHMRKVYSFKDKLTELGVSATVRRTMGEDIEGACGQLRNKTLKTSN